jgi:hypothetical protein
MGLLDKLTTQGSTLSQYDGGIIPVNPLATNQSNLHANLSGQPGYSLDGANTSTVTAQYNAYDDGVPNQIPLPSLLDTNGVVPPISAGGQALPYINNLPQ